MIPGTWTNWDAKIKSPGRGISPTAAIFLVVLIWFTTKSVQRLKVGLPIWNHIQAGDIAAAKGKKSVALRDYQLALKEMPNSMVVKERIGGLGAAGMKAEDTLQDVRERRTFILKVMEKIVSMIFWLR